MARLILSGSIEHLSRKPTVVAEEKEVGLVYEIVLLLVLYSR